LPGKLLIEQGDGVLTQWGSSYGPSPGPGQTKKLSQGPGQRENGPGVACRSKLGTYNNGPSLGFARMVEQHQQLIMTHKEELRAGPSLGLARMVELYQQINMTHKELLVLFHTHYQTLPECTHTAGCRRAPLSHHHAAPAPAQQPPPRLATP